jgi:hypothetical protein
MDDATVREKAGNISFLIVISRLTNGFIKGLGGKGLSEQLNRFRLTNCVAFQSNYFCSTVLAHAHLVLENVCLRVWPLLSELFTHSRDLMLPPICQN